MGEWKRVFLSRKRLFTVLIMVFLCCLLFYMNQLPEIGAGETELLREINEYRISLYNKWENCTTESIQELAEKENEKLYDYVSWYSGNQIHEFPYDTDREADQSVQDTAHLVQNKHDLTRLRKIVSAYLDITEEAGEQAEYVFEYSEYLEKIQNQAEEQSASSIFGKTGSFSARNLNKTTADFKKLQEKEVKTVWKNFSAVQYWLQFTIADYFVLFALIIIILSFLEERKTGLNAVIRITKNGRTKLGLQRIGILFAASVIFSFLFSGINFLISVRLYGMPDFSADIQSLEEFRTCTMHLSLLEWLFVFLGAKILCTFAAGLAIWAVMEGVSNVQFSLGILVTALAVEYVLYSYLPVQSAFNILKYLNIFSLIHTADFFTGYLNINIFSFPVGNRMLIACMTITIILMCSFIVVDIQARRYPEGNRDVLGKLSIKLNGILDSIRIHLGLFGWELYKYMIWQHGLLMILLVILASGKLSYSSYRILDDYERTYYLYVEDLEGPVDAATTEYLEKAYENAGKASNSSYRAVVQDLSARVTDIRNRAAKGKYRPWIVDDRIYDAFYGDSSKNKQRLNAAIAIFFLIILISGVTCYENQTGTVQMIRSLKKGRSSTFNRKVILVLLITSIVFLSVYLRELIQFFTLTPGTLAAAVQNIDDLADFPLVISIGTYLVILYMLRYLTLLSVSFFIMCVSSFLKNIRHAYMVNIALLGIPAFLTLLGAEYFKLISPVCPAASAEILWNAENLPELILPYLICFLFGFESIILYNLKWVGEKRTIMRGRYRISGH